MRRTFFAAFALSMVALAGAASAREPITAETEAALAAPLKVVASGLVWTCEGQTCAAASAQRPSLGVCRDLAKEIGRVRAFSSPSRTFTEEALARCNESAKPAEQN